MSSFSFITNNHRKLIYTIFFLIFLLSAPSALFSHPLDITYTTLTPLQNGFYCETYIHPYEVNLLLNDQGITMENTQLEQMKEPILNYFKERFVVYRGNEPVQLYNLQLEERNLSEILSDGLYVLFNIQTYAHANIFTFEIDLFTEYFRTQTNKIILLEADGLSSNYPEVVLTYTRKTFTLDVNNPDFSSEEDNLRDRDGDGLTDHMERNYGFNMTKADSDDDGVDDFTEFYYGSDPMDPTVHPDERLYDPAYGAISSIAESQDYEETNELGSDGSPDNAIQQTQEQENMESAVEFDNPQVHRPSQTSQYAIVRDSLGYIESALATDLTVGSFLMLLLLAFILGFIHAAFPGHSKGILFGYLVDKDKNMGQALKYILIFTVTHLVDVIILSIGLHYLFESEAMGKYFTIAQIIGVIGLIIIGGFQIFKGRKDLLAYKNGEVLLDKEKEESKAIADLAEKSNQKNGDRKAWVVGFLAGIAPCPFGWAILMLLLSFGRVDLITPVIIVFGLGIIVFLLLYSALIIYGKGKVYGRFNKIIPYSGLASGVLIITFTVLYGYYILFIYQI